MLGRRLATSLVFTIAIIMAVVSAGSKDLCTPGSDSECARFGTNMCCAKINYTFNKDTQEFFACASRPGIEYSNGVITDQFGFSGTWYCAFAKHGLSLSFSAAAIAIASLNF